MERSAARKTPNAMLFTRAEHAAEAEQLLLNLDWVSKPYGGKDADVHRIRAERITRAQVHAMLAALPKNYTEPEAQYS